ncbi:phosphate ABC transporter permease subunit PstC [Auraticoccus sp. F435]|uniref:Phosphate transport system permease protein n=1 Tax=Auraticoccus cholistanensis TaxID=2656650 RepID=A0A6A9V2C7_9ACTN|nr:phosphate ABC transporter permease subunit PstC [Auraticoccus cholistanensis]MVA77742.1 phosphate ABC transporter permease subunit PstC [Auraticoccus cholistanensis]
MSQTETRGSAVAQTTDTEQPPVDAPAGVPLDNRSGRFGDRLFSGISLAAGIVILVVLAGVAAFLIRDAIPAVVASPEELDRDTSFWGYVGPLVAGSVVASLIAILVATPVGVGIALFISHYAPKRLAQPLGYVIDLLAAIPSVVYGAWGALVFGAALVPGYAWLSEHLSFIPIFGPTHSTTGRTLLTAALVLAVMVLPIITSLCRELFLQTPKLHEEAALALGATRWEMIKAAVFPFARAGIVSAVMLGLGRALGETMAVALVLSPGPLTASLISTGNSTIPAEIALGFSEAFGIRRSELIAAGLVLFVITLVVNVLARLVVARYKDFSGAN